MSKLSRRRFIFTAGATAVGTAILHGCATPNNTATSPSPAGSPAASPVVSGETPEVTTAKLGFIAYFPSFEKAYTNWVIQTYQPLSSCENPEAGLSPPDVGGAGGVGGLGRFLFAQQYRWDDFPNISTLF